MRPKLQRIRPVITAPCRDGNERLHLDYARKMYPLEWLTHFGLSAHVRSLTFQSRPSRWPFQNRVSLAEADSGGAGVPLLPPGPVTSALTRFTAN
jgi:hypothetical protein